MQCKIFRGIVHDALQEYNRWAKGKNLNREVIIHELIMPPNDQYADARIMIFVYCPEGKEWDTTEQQEHIKELEQSQIEESAHRETF